MQQLLLQNIYCCYYDDDGFIYIATSSLEKIYVTKWYDTYKDKGFAVIGVRKPEFAFEKEKANVQTATERLGIHYPGGQDNDYATWKAFKNQYWPAEYLIDQNRDIVYEHFGKAIMIIQKMPFVCCLV